MCFLNYICKLSYVINVQCGTVMSCLQVSFCAVMFVASLRQSSIAAPKADTCHEDTGAMESFSEERK